MSYLAIFLLTNASVFVVYFYFAFAEIILRSNKTEADEAKRMLGSFRQFWDGQLAHNPITIGDFRATRGLAFDKAKKKITLQSTLSSAKFRAIYNT